jgi:hypothetical protein
MAGTSEALAQRCAGERMNFALPKVWQLSCLEKLVQLCPGVIKESQGQAVWDIPQSPQGLQQNPVLAVWSSERNATLSSS